jgi:hypothetical protein
MKPVNFKESNTIFRRPDSMTEEECGDLHVHNTGGALISKWEPTEEERKAIANGAPVYLWVIGQVQPPVSLQVESPFREETIQ